MERQIGEKDRNKVSQCLTTSESTRKNAFAFRHVSAHQSTLKGVFFFFFCKANCNT